MKHYCTQWIEEWCQDNGWTDLFMERNLYWAFPPQAVIPEPIPVKVLQLIKEEKGLCPEEKTWLLLAGIAALGAIAGSLALSCPVPLVLGFAFNAVAVAKLEVEYF